MSRDSRRAKTRRTEQRARRKNQLPLPLTPVGQLVKNQQPVVGNVLMVAVEEEYGYGYHAISFVGTKNSGTYQEQRDAAIIELEKLFRYGCFPGLRYWFFHDHTTTMVRGLEQFSTAPTSIKGYEKLSADMMCATAHVHGPDDSYLVLPLIGGSGRRISIDKARQEEAEELHALGQPSYIDVYCTEDQVAPEPKLLSAP
jgi:hypothetical protein